MILGLIEHAEGALSERTLEMLTLARTLSKDLDTALEAVLIGEAGDDVAGALAGSQLGKRDAVGEGDKHAPETQLFAGKVVHSFTDSLKADRQSLVEERKQRMKARQKLVAASNRMYGHTDAANGVVPLAVAEDAVLDYETDVLLQEAGTVAN